MQFFATFVKNKCNFFNGLVQQKLALLIIKIISQSLYGRLFSALCRFYGLVCSEWTSNLIQCELGFDTCPQHYHHILTRRLCNRNSKCCLASNTRFSGNVCMVVVIVTRHIVAANTNNFQSPFKI